LNLRAICEASGVGQVQVVDTWDRKGVMGALRRALAYPGPAVVIAQGPCQQLPEMKYRELVPFYVDEQLCTQCEACFKVWCPAIVRNDRDFPEIVATECTACTVCAQVCPTEAIYPYAHELQPRV
jgi:indolepyruvate ferredoxin oxidoreductase alpha subunit